MKCENCKKEHNGNFATGRFCDIKCARSFSSNINRKETDKKRSETLKAKFLSGELKKPDPTHCFKKGYDTHRRIFTDEDRKNAVIISQHKLKERIKNTPFENLSKNVKKRIILNEQNENCLCGISEWNGKKLTLQLDHIDGNRNNELRENLRLLCPNCHSITETYAGKNSYKRTATDDELWNAINSTPNIHQALKSLGLNNGRNYARIQKLVLEKGLEPSKL